MKDESPIRPLEVSYISERYYFFWVLFTDQEKCCMVPPPVCVASISWVKYAEGVILEGEIYKNCDRADFIECEIKCVLFIEQDWSEKLNRLVTVKTSLLGLFAWMRFSVRSASSKVFLTVTNIKMQGPKCPKYPFGKFFQQKLEDTWSSSREKTNFKYIVDEKFITVFICSMQIIMLACLHVMIDSLPTGIWKLGGTTCFRLLPIS